MNPKDNESQNASGNSNDFFPREFLSFLEVETSFFTPWNSSNCNDHESSSTLPRYMTFQSGSFFKHELFADWEIGSPGEYESLMMIKGTFSTFGNQSEDHQAHQATSSE